jgi:hypothetical protein
VSSLISGIVIDMSDDVVEVTGKVKEEVSQELQEKKLSWKKLRRYDSLDIESRSFPGSHQHGHASKVCLHDNIVNIY